MIQLLPSRTFLCMKPQAGVCGQGLWRIVSWSITSPLRTRVYFPTGAFQAWNVNTMCHGTIKFFPALRVTCTKPQLGFGKYDAHWFVIEDHHICVCVCWYHPQVRWKWRCGVPWPDLDFAFIQTFYVYDGAIRVCGSFQNGLISWWLSQWR